MRNSGYNLNQIRSEWDAIYRQSERMKPVKQQLFIQLGALMEKHGFTNQSLSDASGVPAGTISGIRSGQIANPGFEAVCAMMRAMGESVDALMGIVPTRAPIDEEKLTADGYTQTEIRAIMRWAGSEISRTYKAIVAGLEARIVEKDERLTHRDTLIADEHRRAEQQVSHAQRQTKLAIAVSYITLGLFVLLFSIDFLLPAAGWIRR